MQSSASTYPGAPPGPRGCGVNLALRQRGVLEAGFANPLIFWEVLEDPKAREGARKPSSRVLLDGIRGPAGDGLQE